MPTVYGRPVYFPNEQQITWQKGVTIEVLQEAMRVSLSKLTAFFHYTTGN
jgi:arginine deiminase